MTAVTITRDDTGKLIGFTQKDKRAYARLRKFLEALGAGELMEVEFWVPRSPKFHRLHFGMIGVLFDRQERFNDYDDLRKWVTVGAGFVTYVPGKDGGVVALPASLKYRSLDDEQFGDLHERTKAFLRSTYAQSTLWPHLDRARAAEGVETMLEGFER